MKPVNEEEHAKRGNRRKDCRRNADFYGQNIMQDQRQEQECCQDIRDDVFTAVNYGYRDAYHRKDGKCIRHEDFLSLY